MEEKADGTESAQPKPETSPSKSQENGSAGRAVDAKSESSSPACSPMKKARTKKTESAVSSPDPKLKEDTVKPREKRSRTSTQPFQSSMSDQTQQVVAGSARGKNQPSGSTAAKVVLYEKNEYLAVRCDGDDFFLCKALQNVYRTSKTIKIYWLNNDTEDSSAKNYYTLDFADTIEPETILTNLTLQKVGSRLMLPEEERVRTLNILDRSIKVQNGELPPPDPKDLTEDGLDVSLVAETETEDLSSKEKPAPKQKKRPRKPHRSKTASGRDEDSGSEEEEKEVEEVMPAKVARVREPKPVPQGIKYLKGDFLAVKNESDGYYICKVLVNIHQAAKTAKIQWLHAEPSCANTFVLDYVDTISTEIILTKLNVPRQEKGRIQLTPAERKRAEKVLEEVLKAPNGSRRGNENGASKQTASEKRNGNESGKNKSESPAGMRLTIRRVNDDHSSSLLATDIPQMTEDPLWNDNNPEGGNISPTSDSTDRLFACVFQRDHVGLRRLLSSAQIISPYVYQSVHVQNLALSYAVEAHDVASIRILLGRDCKIKTCKRETNLLRCLDNERNKKEGNGALLQDYVLDPPLPEATAIAKVKDYALEKGVSVDVLEELLGKDAISESNAIKALENGNFELAVGIASAIQSRDDDVTKVPLIKKMLVSGELEANDLFKVVNSNQTTLFHLLMAMPTLDVLSSVLYSSKTVNMDQSIRDLIAKRDILRRAPIHYAAASRTTTNLEWLINRGANLYEIDNEGRNVLHVIASHGREESLTLLMKMLGSAHLDDSDRYGQTPLHRAIISCQPQIVERLLAFGADANKALGSHSDRVTPLMLAAQRGNHLQMLMSLLKYVDRVDTQDKRNRSALIHAAMNGHTAAACLLLRHGANPHLVDNSGNCALHHAAAYGHLFVVKLLVEIANLSPAQLNDAKMCSLEVAFRKGHIGLVKYMLGLGCFARGFDCELGETLLSACVQMGDLLEPTQVSRFEVLLKSSPQLALKTDSQGNNIYHRLVHMEHRVMLQQLDKSDEALQEHRECLASIVDLVLGLPVANRGLEALNNEKETPVACALSHGSFWFATRFGDAEPSVLKAAIKTENALKKIAMHCSSHSVEELMASVVGDKSEIESLKELSKSLLQKNVNLLLLALQCAADIVNPREVSNVCSFIHFLFSVVEFDPSGAILHSAIRCRSSEFLKTILESAGSALNREARQQGLTALQNAAIQGNSEAVLLLLKHGARSQLMMPPSFAHPSIPLFLFCCRPENPFTADVVRTMINNKTTNLLEKHPVTGDTVLHYVVQKKNWPVEDRISTVKLLLQKGLSASALNVRQQNPLHLAALSNPHGDARVEYALVEAGASIEALDAAHRLPLHYLFLSPSAEQDPIEACRVISDKSMLNLIDSTADRGSMQTVLHYAASAGATLCCRHILSLGANLEVRNKYGNTPAALAIIHEKASTLLAFIERGCCLTEEVCVPAVIFVPSTQLIWRYVFPKQTMPTRKTLLQAVFEIARRGVEGIEHDDKSDADERSLQCSKRTEDGVFINRSELIERERRFSESSWTSLIPGLLIDQLEMKGHPISLAVDAAVRAENYDLALKLLTRVKNGWTLTLILRKQTMLHLVAQQKYSEGQIKVVQALLDKEVIPHALDEHGCSALTYANINWNHILANFLLEKIGVEAAAQIPADRSFRTPLSAIFWRMEKDPLPKPMIDIALRLIRAGGNINVLSCYPVLNLEFPGTICVSENVTHVTHTAAARISPLIMAVCKKNHETARFLLREGGANPNFVDGQQRTALMYAVKLNDLNMAKLLLNYDYDIQENKFNSYVDGCLPGPKASSREDEEIKKFVKTSPVDLAHQDIYGWSVIHHVVAPLPEMTYASTRMLRLLATVKAPLTVPDRNSIAPLHLSAARGVESLTLALQELITDDTPCPRIAYHGLPAINDEGVMSSLPLRNFNADSEAYEEQQRGKHGTNNGHGGTEEEITAESTVDSFGLSEPDEWEIVTDAKTKTSYDVLLTKLNLHYIYLFCKLQLVTTFDRSRFVVVERSGRVGDIGSAKRTAFPSESEAVQEFRRLFQSCTGCKFDDLSTLRPTPNAFRPVSVNWPRLPKETNDKESADKVFELLTLSSQASKLTPTVQNLLKTIIRDCSQVLRLPTDDCLRQALSILEEMRHLCGEKKELEKNAQSGNVQLGELMLRLTERGHQYYALLPPEDVIKTANVKRSIALEQLEPLCSEDQIDEQLSRVFRYLDLQMSQKIFKGALYASNEINSLDYIYRSSQCRMQWLPLTSLEMQTVLQYIHNSSRHEQIVKNVFRLSRESEEAAMTNGDVGNHWLLWHPVESTSVLSVLCRGVQATPLGGGWPTQVKGIKFYDRFEHEPLCRRKLSNNSRFELLCQVALGDQNGKPGKANGGNSVALMGRWGPDAADHVSWQSCLVPLGPTVFNGNRDAQERAFNEYVVYKPQQVCIRYLVEYQQTWELRSKAEAKLPLKRTAANRARIGF